MDNQTKELAGKRIVDISDLLDIFQAQEGIIEHIIGKTGNGKTYYATLRAYELLLQGNVVYTTWKMILPDVYDQRTDFETVFWKTVMGKKQFYKYNLKENWKWIDIDRPDLKEYIASLTDCFVFLDEGQDIFSSHDRIDGQARRTITRTRHMRKTLVIVSQRAQAVDTNARANVSHYYKCVKQIAWFWPFRPFFRVFTTEDMDDANIPVWEEHIPYSNGKVWRAPIYRQYFFNKKISELYNSWYLRDGIEKSQEVNFEAYELSLWDKVKTLKSLLGKKKEKPLDRPLKEPSSKVKELSTHLRKKRKGAVQYIHEEAQKEGTEKKEVYTFSGSRYPALGNNVLNLRRQEAPEIAYDNPRPKRTRSKRLEQETAEARPETTRKTIRVKAQSASSIA